jgi:hypothetical protein
MGEIEALPGYCSEIGQPNIGYYDFDDEVFCCVRRDSARCATSPQI